MEELVNKIDALEHQHDFWSCTKDLAEIGMVGPLGTGKTYSLAMKCLQLAVANGNLHGLLVTPTYSMARMIHATEWPEIMRGYGIQLEWVPSMPAFKWPWGAVTWVVSAEKPQRLAGPNMAYVLFDEPGQMEREAWDRGSIRARHPKARLRQTCVAGTPEGVNWFADVFDKPTHERITIRSCSWHPNVAFYPKKISDTYGYDPSLLAAYGQGLFVELRVGRAYRQFDRNIHCPATGVPYQPSLPLVLACDFNVDAMRWVVMQFGSDFINCLDEIALGKSGTTEQAAIEFCNRWSGKHRGHLVITGDHSGTARSTSGRVDYQTMVEVMDPQFFSVTLNVPSVNPLQKARVDNANYHFSGRGKRVSVDAEECPELVMDLTRVKWKKGSVSSLDDSDPLRTHASDAATYAMWQLARVSGAAGLTVHAPEGPGVEPSFITEARF